MFINMHICKHNHTDVYQVALSSVCIHANPYIYAYWQRYTLMQKHVCSCGCILQPVYDMYCSTCMQTRWCHGVTNRFIYQHICAIILIYVERCWPLYLRVFDIHAHVHAYTRKNKQKMHTRRVRDSDRLTYRQTYKDVAFLLFHKSWEGMG